MQQILRRPDYTWHNHTGEHECRVGTARSAMTISVFQRDQRRLFVDTNGNRAPGGQISVQTALVVFSIREATRYSTSANSIGSYNRQKTYSTGGLKSKTSRGIAVHNARQTLSLSCSVSRKLGDIGIRDHSSKKPPSLASSSPFAAKPPAYPATLDFWSLSLGSR